MFDKIWDQFLNLPTTLEQDKALLRKHKFRKFENLASENINATKMKIDALILSGVAVTTFPLGRFLSKNVDFLDDSLLWVMAYIVAAKVFNRLGVIAFRLDLENRPDFPEDEKRYDYVYKTSES